MSAVRTPLPVPDFHTEQQAQQWVFRLADDDCIDNYRFAYHDDPIQMRAYDKAHRGGCCGYVDRDVLVNGRLARVGCNYGH